MTQRKTFTRMNERGLLETLDAETFELVSIQRAQGRPGASPEHLLVSQTLPDGRILLVDPGIEDYGKALGYEVSEIMVDLICQKITEGTALTKICKTPGFVPYFVFVKWMRKHPWIRQAVEAAREDRAEFLRDEIMEISDSADADADEIAKAKLRVESRKWGAAVDSPARYGKAEKNGQQSFPLQIIVSTGILRPGDEGFRDVGEIKNGENNTRIDSTDKCISSDGGNTGTA